MTANQALWDYLKGWIWQQIQPLFWPVEAPNHHYIRQMVRQCPMPWPNFDAVCRKRQFVWRFAYWVRYLKPDRDNAMAYWELVIANNDPDFWKSVSPCHKVSVILHCMLTDQKLPTRRGGR